MISIYDLRFKICRSQRPAQGGTMPVQYWISLDAGGRKGKRKITEEIETPSWGPINLLHT